MRWKCCFEILLIEEVRKGGLVFIASPISWPAWDVDDQSIFE
jgi:hypothetical protein